MKLGVSRQTSPSCQDLCCEVVSYDYLRPLGRPTRKYLKATRPSPAGNIASHFRQRILPCTPSQVSIVTNLYSASQPGQRKGIGSDWLIVRLRKKMNTAISSDTRSRS